ncbi:serine/threonine-protein kinase [Planctomycetota bacterium]|nr:serine/threonine-protein kinase [Planctomycetota bacterium]
MTEEGQPEFKPVDEKTLLDVASGSDSGIVFDGDGLNLKFGQVRCTAELGAGGMGKVYKGHHEGLDKPVAVKVMGGALAADPTGKARFLREARTAAKIDHPNVVRVLDVNEQDGIAYIVMEFIDGTDLSELVKKHGALDPAGVYKAVAQVADGLAHAHAQGIVHRDIKPHNIFISKSGQVKLGDFGLARAVEATTELTMPGAAIGTAHYMSPEQAQGSDLDQRSDIYSLGVTAFHLLTGTPPYKGTTPLSVAVQHVNKEVPYDRENFGHIPDALVYVLIKMTARDANVRPNAKQVHDEIGHLLMQTMQQSGVKLNTMSDLLRTNVANQSTPTQPMAPAPTAPPMAHTPTQPMHPQTAFQTPATHMPTHYSQPLPAKKDNTLIWVALGLLLLFMAIFGGCAMYFAAAV